MNAIEEGPILEFLMDFRDVFPTDLLPGFPLIYGIENQMDLTLGASLANKVAYHFN